MKKLFLLALTLLMPMVTEAKMVAYSVGTDYGTAVDTSIDATNATSAYYGTGLYSAYYNTKPTYQYLRGNNPHTNKPRLESNIVFLSGHGNYDRLVFNYLGKGGDYATGVYSEKNTTLNNYYKVAGLKSYNMNNVGMIIFAACLTGKEGVRNIADTAVLQGATVSIGWRQSIEAPSHTLWLNRFNKALAKGKTLWDAVQEAGKYSYDDNAVKDMSIYGDFNNYKITNTYTTATINTLNHSENNTSESLKDYDVSIIFENDDDMREKLSNYIISNIDSAFDLSEYKEESSKVGDTTFYDYKYLKGSVVTNSAITAIVKDNCIINIVDNRVEIDGINDSMAIESDLDDESKIKETATNKILENANYEIDSQTIEKVYDENGKMLKWKVRSVVHEKDSDSYFVNVYYENL